MFKCPLDFFRGSCCRFSPTYFNAMLYPVRLPEISEAEKQLIQGTADFFALNMYTAFLVEHKEFPADVEWNYLSDQQMKTTSHPSWRRGISMGPCSVI